MMNSLIICVKRGGLVCIGVCFCISIYIECFGKYECFYNAFEFSKKKEFLFNLFDFFLDAVFFKIEIVIKTSAPFYINFL
jgi:uncharacterized membrane protein